MGPGRVKPVPGYLPLCGVADGDDVQRYDLWGEIEQLLYLGNPVRIRVNRGPDGPETHGIGGDKNILGGHRAVSCQYACPLFFSLLWLPQTTMPTVIFLSCSDLGLTLAISWMIWGSLTTTNSVERSPKAEGAAMPAVSNNLISYPGTGRGG